jgi:hypothetical protein
LYSVLHTSYFYTNSFLTIPEITLPSA